VRQCPTGDPADEAMVELDRAAAGLTDPLH